MSEIERRIIPAFVHRKIRKLADLLAIAERSGLPFAQLAEAARRLLSTDLLREFSGHFRKVCPGLQYTPPPVLGD